MKAIFKTTEKQIYRRLFCILNAFYDNDDKKLTNTEINLLVEFLLLPRKKFEYQPFSTLAKTKVMETAKEYGWILSRENVNNKLYALVTKGYLWKDEDGVMYWQPHIKQLIDLLRDSLDKDQKFTMPITFILKEDDQELQDN